MIAVNDRRADVMLKKIVTVCEGGLKGKTVCLLGLTFKPNTDDLRESPAMAILERLVDQGATVRAFDPIANQILSGKPRPNVVFCDDEYDAAEGADLLVLATEWNQFRSLDFERLKGLLAKPVVVDLRNIYEPETMRSFGFEYVGVGR